MKFIYTGYFRFPNGDAAASRVLNNARLLRDLGHDVLIISFGGSARDEDRCETGYVYDRIRYINTRDIDTHSLKERALRYISPAPNAISLILKYAKEYDGIISYNPTAPLNLRLKKICKRFGLYYIVDLTEWPAYNEVYGGKYSPIYWQSEYNFRHIQKGIANIIPISTYLKDYYKNSNSILLPPLIDINDEKWSNHLNMLDSIIEKFDGVRLVFAGTPAKKDLLGNLINAMCEILPEYPKFQLVVAGVSQDAARHYFLNPDNLDKFCTNFVFLGRIPQDKVPSIYRISDFSAIIREPSRKNMAGFPTKMAESMASGCPVLLNYTSDLEQYAIDGKNAIVIPDYTIESIKNGLKRISEFSRDDISCMKDNARDVGQRMFDYRNYKAAMGAFLDCLQ